MLGFAKKIRCGRVTLNTHFFFFCFKASLAPQNVSMDSKGLMKLSNAQDDLILRISRMLKDTFSLDTTQIRQMR